MNVLKEYSCNRADGSPRLTYFQLDISGTYYAIYGDDECAMPVIAWGIDDGHGSHITPLVLHSEFGLVPAWAFSIGGNHFKGVITRSEM